MQNLQINLPARAPTTDDYPEDSSENGVSLLLVLDGSEKPISVMLTSHPSLPQWDLQQCL